MKHLKWIVLILMFFSAYTTSWSQKEKEVKVKTEHGKLYGSLTSVSNKKKSPIVLIIPGSGPTDRNGNSVLLQSNSYKFLAQDLAKNGISSLRYDKLLVGKSKADIEEKDLRFNDNVDFVTAWIDYLHTKKYKNIVLLGHSEGSLIGMLAAQKGIVSKFISLAGTGRSIDEVLAEQISEQSPKVLSEVHQVLMQLKEGKIVKSISPELSGIFRPSVQPYLISWLKYDPKEEIEKINVPVLILHGSTDIQVTEKDADLQKQGNSSAELIIIKEMNHILKEAPKSIEENMKTYYNPKLPLHPELIPTLVKFIK